MEPQGLGTGPRSFTTWLAGGDEVQLPVLMTSPSQIAEVLDEYEVSEFVHVLKVNYEALIRQCVTLQLLTKDCSAGNLLGEGLVVKIAGVSPLWRSI